MSRVWLCITPERSVKTEMILSAFAESVPGKPMFIVGPPPDDGQPFAVWGQDWTAREAIPKAVKSGRAFWHLDNGFIKSAQGSRFGYYRVTYRGLSPILIEQPLLSDRARDVHLKPWRRDGDHVLFALPGQDFGRAIGLNMVSWIETMSARMKTLTARPVLTRPKKHRGGRPLQVDLNNCWALITHSSNVAVEAAIAGIPVFVEPTNPAAPIGNEFLEELEFPAMPDRSQWIESLMCQQFTLDEMKSGIAMPHLERIMEQVDDGNLQSRPRYAEG